MIKNIVLHTDKETMVRIKEQEKRFQEMHQGIVDMVKQKHTQFDALLERLIQSSSVDHSSVAAGDLNEQTPKGKQHRRSRTATKLCLGSSQASTFKPSIDAVMKLGQANSTTKKQQQQECQETLDVPPNEAEAEDGDAIEIESSSEFLNLNAAVTT